MPDSSNKRLQIRFSFPTLTEDNNHFSKWLKNKLRKNHMPMKELKDELEGWGGLPHIIFYSEYFVRDPRNPASYFKHCPLKEDFAPLPLKETFEMAPQLFS